METFLFVAALLAFAAATLNCLRLAFGRSINWGMTCSLLPLAWVPFYGFDWERLRGQAVTHLLTLIAFVFCSVLFIRSNPFIFDNSLLSGLRDTVAPAFAQAPLPLDAPRFASDYEIKRQVSRRDESYGRFLGRDYVFKQVVFADGILRFKQLSSEQPVEFAIDLHDYAVADSGSLVLDLTPASAGLPLVHVMQYQRESALPDVNSFERDYWLELVLDRVTEERYQGRVLMRLPDGRKGYLAGNFNASTKDLLWELGDVNRSYDSNDTIEYVASQYLINNLGSSLLNVVDFNDTFFQTNLEESTAQTLVTIATVDGGIHDIAIELYKNQNQWVVERTPVRELVGALQTIQQLPPASISAQPTLARIETYSAEDLESLVGRKVAILTQDGKTREGTIGSVDRYNVSLVTLLGGGEVAYMVKRREVKEVRVQE